MTEEQIKHIANLISQDIEKDKEIERLIKELKLKTDFIQDLLEIIYNSNDTKLHTEAHLYGEEYQDKLKELKEGK